jgi:hypothetical protein
MKTVIVRIAAVCVLPLALSCAKEAPAAVSSDVPATAAAPAATAAAPPSTAPLAATVHSNVLPSKLTNANLMSAQESTPGTGATDAQVAALVTKLGPEQASTAVHRCWFAREGDNCSALCAVREPAGTWALVAMSPRPVTAQHWKLPQSFDTPTPEVPFDAAVACAR